MSFDRPTLTQIDDRARADMEANMDAVPIVRRRTPLAGIARALAGASHELHGHLQWIKRQVFPTSETSTLHLERHASLKGLTRRAAAFGVGSIRVTGTDGSIVDAGAALGSADGVEIATMATAIIAGGIAIIPVQAVATGLSGNLGDGARVAFLSPVAGVSSEAFITAPGMSAGADAEIDGQLLDRLLFRYRRPAHGGAENDYIRWATEVPGVTQAWVAHREMGLGTVTVRIAVDDAPHGPIPTAEEVQAVETHIQTRASVNELREGRPVTAELYVAAPVAAPVDVTLTITPDTAAIRTQIIDELKQLFRRIARPGGVVSRDTISQAISLAPELTERRLTVPATDAVRRRGHLPTLGEVTFL